MKLKRLKELKLRDQLLFIAGVGAEDKMVEKRNFLEGKTVKFCFKIYNLGQTNFFCHIVLP